MRPLFSIVERLSYEVTEIALDRPGVQLNFQQSEEVNFKTAFITDSVINAVLFCEDLATKAF